MMRSNFILLCATAVIALTAAATSEAAEAKAVARCLERGGSQLIFV